MYHSSVCCIDAVLIKGLVQHQTLKHTSLLLYLYICFMYSILYCMKPHSVGMLACHSVTWPHSFQACSFKATAGEIVLRVVKRRRELWPRVILDKTKVQTNTLLPVLLPNSLNPVVTEENTHTTRTHTHTHQLSINVDPPPIPFQFPYLQADFDHLGDSSSGEESDDSQHEEKEGLRGLSPLK